VVHRFGSASRHEAYTRIGFAYATKQIRPKCELLVRLGPGQFELEMRFRSVWLQRLPLFDQVIAIFKKQLETIYVFRSFFPIGDVLEHEDHPRGAMRKRRR
jgi:hypothetical protein